MKAVTLSKEELLDALTVAAERKAGVRENEKRRARFHWHIGENDEGKPGSFSILGVRIELLNGPGIDAS